MNNLPYNPDAERLILSFAITKPDTTALICKTLSVESFYLEKHQIIFNTIQHLVNTNKSVDLLTVTTYIRDHFLLEEIGGLQTITDLMRISSTGLNVVECLGLVQDKFIRRSLINLGYETIEAGYKTKFSIESAIQRIESKLFELNKKNVSGHLLSNAEVISSVLEVIKEKTNKISELGLMSLFYDLDAITQGFQKSDLIIIAGRPSMGKTAFCLNLTRNIALKYQKTILLFSLEMSKEQLCYRLLASECGIDLSRLRTGKIKKEELSRLESSIAKLSRLPIFIDDNPTPSISEIKLKIREILIERNEIGIVIIDYLQLLPPPNNKSNRVQEISEITRLLKALARDFNIPIIALSQLSRNVETRNNKRPILSDLRESGCLYIKQPIWSQTHNKCKYVFTYSGEKLRLNKEFSIRPSGIKPCYSLYFNKRKRLILTSNHKLLTNKGWKRVDELKITDHIVHYLKNTRDNVELLKKEEIHINKISYSGLKLTYDLNVRVDKNFVSEGFILHNSIEQDADVVIMLYRDDYYNKKTSTPNIIELQIAKHRNGPLGLVKLYFNPKINRCYNLSKPHLN